MEQAGNGPSIDQKAGSTTDRNNTLVESYIPQQYQTELCTVYLCYSYSIYKDQSHQLIVSIIKYLL